MKIFELILWLITATGLIFKIFNIDGGSLLILLGLFFLLLLYTFLSFALFNDIRLKHLFNKSAYAHTTSGRILGAVLTGFVLAMVAEGILFKLLIWDGRQTILLVSLVSLIPVLILCSYFLIRKQDRYYRKILTRSIFLMVLGGSLFLTPDATLVDIYYRHNKAYAEIYKKHLKAPDNQEIINRMREMEKEMFYGPPVKTREDVGNP